MSEQVPHAEKGKKCPFHRVDMSKVCHTCPLWISVKGKNPNTGEDIDRWNCSLSWLPLMVIENSLQTRQTSAAVESMRNEFAKHSEITNQLLIEVVKQQHLTQQQLNTGERAKVIEG
jgi:hypothetical protein